MSSAAKANVDSSSIGTDAKSPESKSKDRPSPPTARSKPLIYFVDDEPDMLEVFEACFARKFEVRTFPSAYDLVETFAGGNIPVPQLIVTDLRMAKMDGVKMLAALKSMGHEIPAILLSGNVDKSSAVEALNHGFYRILEKPFEPATLESYINELLMEAKISRVREEVRLHVRKLAEIYQAMRMLLAGRVDNLNEILDEAVRSQGSGTESFEDIVSRLEKRLDELLKVEEVTDLLRKGRR